MIGSWYLIMGRLHSSINQVYCYGTMDYLGLLLVKMDSSIMIVCYPKLNNDTHYKSVGI